MRLRRELRPFLRLQFLAAASQVGVIEQLRTPKTAGELAAELGLTQLEMLCTLLDLGVALGELKRTPSGYQLRGSVSLALLGAEGAALRAAVLELVDYHADVYRTLSEHLRTGRQGEYLADRGELIASSSRLIEPALATFVQSLVRGRGDTRVLELGCGSGTYLRHAAAANPKVRGFGVDAEPRVVASTRAAISDWGIDDRFTILHADARRLPAEVNGAFDLITLYNNVYYFNPAERRSLFRELAGRLASGGRLVVVSMMHADTVASLDLSLVLAATRGCTALPVEHELTELLRQSGFARVSRARLLPGEPFTALVATALPSA